LSDYLENTLGAEERAVMQSHLNACRPCTELLAGMRDVVAWAGAFPVYEPPVWLASRILANTPRVVRETWLDTLLAAARWFIEPRTAIGLLTAVLMVGWVASAAGVSGLDDVVSLAQNPAAACYNAYDAAVRTFYRAPLVTEIQSQIERLRERS
jgi:hypothetical protein